jgi:hypothetical protein
MSNTIKEVLQLIDELGNLVSEIDNVIRTYPQDIQEFLYGKIDEKLEEAFGETVNDEALFGDLDPDRIVN